MSDEIRSPSSAASPSPLPDEEIPRPGESFLSRFHRRKTQARQSADLGGATENGLPEAEVPGIELPAVSTADAHSGNDASAEADRRIEPTDDDMPPLEALDSDSDYSGFLSSKVSESLRRAALRKLFHGVEFNVVDGLDEYADDFTKFAPLGDLVTADMRHQLEAEARRQAEALKQALLDQDDRDDEAERDDQVNLDRPAKDKPRLATATPGSTAVPSNPPDSAEPENTPSPPAVDI